MTNDDGKDLTKNALADLKGSGTLIPLDQFNSLSSARQTENNVQGNMAGRDVNEVHIHLPPEKPKSQLSRLYSRLAAEAEGDKTLTAYISQLEIFTRQVENEKVIGLEGKLVAAGRSDDLHMAMAMKEAVFAGIRENLFSPTYQRIAATLMGKIHEAFHTEIKPLIRGSAPRSDIDQAVNLRVIGPIVAELEECPDFDEAPIPLVRGMLYFLTGNCHVSWH
ncbi:ABC-three component system protein [Mesorhizobium sp. M0590]|uniref:ABC-three component system protein n=1 Tax=Mesorhizobium sp. M0590 TaxID=2956966 RepID=UPI0033365F53